MIKLNYNNGTVIEFDNVLEVKEFLQVSEKPKQAVYQTTVHKLSPFERVKTSGVVAFQRKTKGFKSPTWTLEEVRYILDNVDTLGSNALANSKVLSRHTVAANKQMIWKVRKNPKGSRMLPEIQTLVDAYHGKF